MSESYTDPKTPWCPGCGVGMFDNCATYCPDFMARLANANAQKISKPPQAAKDKGDLTPDEVACLQQGGLVYGRDAKSWGVGMRFNDSKPPVWRGFINYFPRAMEAVSKVSGFGAKKYDWNNWQQLEDGATNCTDSLVRHLINEAKGRTFDVDSEELEAAHAAWNAMARLEFICKEREAKQDQT